MKLDELFADNKQILSFEIFPPKRDSSLDSVYDTIEQLGDLNPAFISVTYGANGSGARGYTLEIASAIKNKYHMETMAHLTCLNHDEKEIDEILLRLKDINVENILALRGDINPDCEPKKVFAHASDLAAYIKAHGDFHISGACYPEGHLESDDLVSDTLLLREKTDAGVDHMISQLFFDNSLFYSFLSRCRLAGISVPIEAGIMPVTNANQIKRMVSMCGASLPPKFAKMIQRYENKPEALEDAGVAYAVDQIVDLLSNGVNGIHLYTMNKPSIARKISTAISSLLK